MSIPVLSIQTACNTSKPFPVPVPVGDGYCVWYHQIWCWRMQTSLGWWLHHHRKEYSYCWRVICECMVNEWVESQWTNTKYKNGTKTYSIIIQMISSTVCCISISSVTWQSSGFYAGHSREWCQSAILSSSGAGPFNCRYILFISFISTGMQCSTLPAIDPSDINASCQTQGFTTEEFDT